MPSLYKYIPEKYVDDFVRSGAVLFRSLSYFRDYEDAQIRGDEFEGTRLYSPAGGLLTNFPEKQQAVLQLAYESSANEDDIFVFCLSTVLSDKLATEFQTSACIEIKNPSRLIGGVRAALGRRPSIKNKTLVHGEVKYYTPEDAPLGEWIPEKIAMSKLSHYEQQKEYRLVFSVNDAFNIDNTRHRLVTPGTRRVQRSSSHPDRLIKIGNISKLCKIHRFP